MVRGTGTSLRVSGRLGTGMVGLIALGTCLVFAQGSTASMSGVVHDGTGAVIPGVTVTIKHTETGLTRTVETTENGGYRMPSLPVGAYEVSLNHQFGASYSYQLPFGSGQRFAGGSSGLVNHLVGGWQWNGIFTAQDGFPFTPLVGSNTSGTGDASQSDVPNWNPNFKGPVILGKPDQWFDPRAFLIPTQGTFGNVSRGSLRGPRLVDFDTSLFKKFTINERLNLQFRAEVFNVLNHANFSYPNGIVFSGNDISPSAGVITQTATTSRQLQFALKLLF